MRGLLLRGLVAFLVFGGAVAVFFVIDAPGVIWDDMEGGTCVCIGRCIAVACACAPADAGRRETSIEVQVSFVFS